MALAIYHASPWIIAGTLVTPGYLWAARRQNRRRDIAGQVARGELARIRRGLEWT